MEVGDLGIVARGGEADQEAVEQRAAERVAAGMVEDDEDLRAAALPVKRQGSPRPAGIGGRLTGKPP